MRTTDQVSSDMPACRNNGSVICSSARITGPDTSRLHQPPAAARLPLGLRRRMMSANFLRAAYGHHGAEYAELPRADVRGEGRGRRPHWQQCRHGRRAGATGGGPL